MQVLPAPHFTCPHDGTPLASTGSTLVCVRKHTFDIAREGYVNLLPVQDKASIDPGDSKDMVAARRRFLDTGAYAPIAAALAGFTLSAINRRAGSAPFTILDAGCGEGYYLQALAAHLARQAGSTAVRLAGIDISKWAVRAAARRNLPVAWAVASNRRPPLPPQSTDLVICLFGFPIWDGFATAQPDGGEVLLIDPGPDHLLELREIIYPEVRRSERGHTTDTRDYRQSSETRVRTGIHVAAQEAIADLLAMTPHAHRGTIEGKAALLARSTLDTTIDVVLRGFKRG